MVVRTEIRLRIGEELAPYLLSGWSEPEPEETWCLGLVSSLSLPVMKPSTDHVLVFKARPYLKSGHVVQQRLNVRVSGQPVASFTLSRNATRACRIPRRLVEGGATIEIQFETPDSARPSDHGDDKDGRRLAFAFSSLLLYPDLPRPDAEDPAVSDHLPPLDLGKVGDIDLSDLMLNFESLGQNCEFGLVQRACQAEPLGLLRFSSSPLPKLLTALDRQFNGLGAPGSFKAIISPNGREYMVQDTAFGLLYHAWVETGRMSASDVEKREARRLPFLVRKLREDLNNAEKVFVFKGMASIPNEEVFPLALAIRRYGSNTLLHVNIADDEHKAGSVEIISTGFLVGYIDRFAPSQDASDFNQEQWIKICREAYRIHRMLGNTHDWETNTSIKFDA